MFLRCYAGKEPGVIFLKPQSEKEYLYADNVFEMVTFFNSLSPLQKFALLCIVVNAFELMAYLLYL